MCKFSSESLCSYDIGLGPVKCCVGPVKCRIFFCALSWSLSFTSQDTFKVESLSSRAFQVEPFKLGLSYSSGARQVQCGARQVQCGVRQVQDFFFNSNLTPSAFF